MIVIYRRCLSYSRSFGWVLPFCVLVLLLCSCYSFSFSCYPMIHFILPFLTLSVYLCFIYVLSVCIFFFITLCLLHLVSSSFSTLLYTSPYSFSFPPSLPCLNAFLSYCYYYNNSYWYCCDSKHRWTFLMRIVPDITQVFSAAWGRHAGYVHPSSRKTSKRGVHEKQYKYHHT